MTALAEALALLARTVEQTNLVHNSMSSTDALAVVQRALPTVTVWERCDRCSGDGEGDHGPCPDCEGAGGRDVVAATPWLTVNEVQVRLRRVVGDFVRVEAQGGDLEGIAPGDYVPQPTDAQRGEVV